MRTLRAITTLAILSPALASCAPPQGGARGPGAVFVETTVFPSRDAVAKIAAAPVPARLTDERGKDVPTWDLVGPLPDAVDRAPPKDESPWGQLFASVAAARGDSVVATEAMRCVARENAAFYLANDKIPAETLHRFIAARCGAATSNTATAVQSITGDPRTPDEQILAKFRDPIRDMLDKTLRMGRVEAGFAFVRKGGKSVIAVSIVPQTVRLERTPLAAGPDGKIVLQGEALTPAVGLRALINRGRHGYAECAVSPGVRLPRFIVTCQASREDEVAWLSVSAQPPGRVLGAPVVEMMVWPSGTLGKTYAKLARPAGDAKSASKEDLLREVNAIRQEAKLPPLRLADQESDTASRLAPHYFAAAENGGGDGLTDQVALGLLAGWEVDGMVRSGHFVSTWVSDASSGAEVVRAALSRPVGRETLLDPTASRLAVGAVAAGSGLGALFSTYSLFDGYRHDDDPRAIAARIAAARAARGVTPPKLVADLSAAADRAAKSVQAGAREPGHALQELLDYTAGTLGRNARGWVGETTSLDRIVFPPEIEASPALAIGIGVAHHRRPNEAWGRFVVMMVILDDGGTAVQTAKLGGPKGL